MTELISCMEPVLKNEIETGTNWIHQIKWDGIRCISYIENNRLRIFTKNGNERTFFYPEVHELANLLDGKQAVIDGEIIVLNDNRPNFSDVLVRERVRSTNSLPKYLEKYPVKYVLFDILYYNYKDLRKLPLNERLSLLRNKVKNNPTITITDDFTDGKSLFNLVKEKNFEGIVSKNINSMYISGKKHNDWIKVKAIKKMLVVIGGIQMTNNIPSSLIIGIYKNKKLNYIGKVRAGLGANDFYILKEYISFLKTENSPFSSLIRNKDIIWLNPILTCWVKFLEWTNDGKLRHPSIIGFSNQNPLEATGKEYSNGIN